MDYRIVKEVQRKVNKSVNILKKTMVGLSMSFSL